MPRPDDGCLNAHDLRRHGCGCLTDRASAAGDSPAAASSRAITARQLQALVRPQLKDALFLRARDLYGGDAPTLGVLNPDVENPGSASVADLAQCPAYEDVAVVLDLLLLRRRRGRGLLGLELGQPLTFGQERAVCKYDREVISGEAIPSGRISLRHRLVASAHGLPKLGRDLRGHRTRNKA